MALGDWENDEYLTRVWRFTVYNSRHTHKVNIIQSAIDNYWSKIKLLWLPYACVIRIMM